MKKLLVILTLIPIITFSQISSWRSPGSSQSYRSPSISYSRPQQNDISQWRVNPPKRNVTPYTGPRRPLYNNYYNPYLGWNRWNMWGAPMYGWNMWEPWFYVDRWGYREPARIYIYNDGRRDTILGKKPHFSFGLQGSTSNQVGFWGTVGKKSYFIFEYNQTNQRDNSTFFPYGRIQDVDFRMVSDLEKISSFYLGAGKRFNRTGVHMMVGGLNEVVRYRGVDDIGYITFPKYEDKNIGLKFGALQDLKNATLKLDIEPFSRSISLGIGVNL
jgi:hypothetical protein